MVICSILAVAGIALGVYGLMSSNNKSSEIAQMKVELTTKDQKLSELESLSDATDTDETTDSDLTNSAATSNPVIASATTSNLLYYPSYQSPNLYATGSTPSTVSIQLANGEISSCTVTTDGRITNNNCEVTGLTGPIYKIVTSGEGQNYNGDVAFIMADGTVQPANLTDLLTTGTTAAQPAYAIDGSVLDAIQTNVQLTDSPIGGYGTTLFILSDGSYLSYGDLNK